VLRAMLEGLTWSWTFTRRLPAAFGRVPIRVSPSAGLRYLFRSMAQIDPALLRLVAQLVRPGDVVWDVGANVGLWTFAAAQRAGATGQVLAIEADVWLVALLRASSTLQPAASARVTILPAAAMDRAAVATLQIAGRSRSSNALVGFGHTQMGSVRETQTVVGVTLDWLLSQDKPPRVVKIDVEGAEALVLRGGAGLLREARPILVVEVGSESAREVSALLHDAGYKIFDGEMSVELAAQTPVPSAPWTTVAIPREMKLPGTGVQSQ